MCGGRPPPIGRNLLLVWRYGLVGFVNFPLPTLAISPHGKARAMKWT